MSIKIKVIIILSVLGNIFNASVYFYGLTLFNCSNYDYAIVSMLSSICIDFFALYICIIISLMFLIYSAILEEYFRYHDSCLVELFDERQNVIGQSPITPTKAYSKVGSLPSLQLLRFLASITSTRDSNPDLPALRPADRVTIPLGHRVG